MEDKLSKRRIKVDYKGLIKGKGLWYVYKQFVKEHKTIKSQNRLMYCFCMRYLKQEVLDVKAWNINLEENIRIAKTPWLDEDE